MGSQHALWRVPAMNKWIHTQIDPAQSQIVFTTDVEGNLKYVNAAGADLTGYSCEELQNLDVFQLLPKNLRQDLSNHIRQALRRRFGKVFEIEITTRAGRRVVLETSLAVIRRPDRSLEFHGVAIEVRDVPETTSMRGSGVSASRSSATLRVGGRFVSVGVHRRVATTPDKLDHSDLSFLR